MNAGSAYKQGRGRQERLIQQLLHDNAVLQRKVASFQVALRADESTSSLFDQTFLYREIARRVLRGATRMLWRACDVFLVYVVAYFRQSCTS